MNQPTLLIGQVYAVEVPEKYAQISIDDVFNELYWWSHDGSETVIPLPPGSWQLIGTTKEVTEELAAQIVERETGGFSGRMTGYKDYVIAGLDMQPLSNAVESLRTLLISKGLDTTRNYMLIKKL